MTKLVIYRDGSFDLQPNDPPARKPKALELVAYFAAALLVSGLGLLALPLLITVLGALAPFAVAGLFIRYLIRRKPWRRP